MVLFLYENFLDSLRWCESWRDPQHILFHLANVCFFISYAAPSNRVGLVTMHSLLVLGNIFSHLLLLLSLYGNLTLCVNLLKVSCCFPVGHGISFV
ncbi:hypothetical protein Phum_PHUM405970, partial [Pediculus humanus corporis]